MQISDTPSPDPDETPLHHALAETLDADAPLPPPEALTEVELLVEKARVRREIITHATRDHIRDIDDTSKGVNYPEMDAARSRCEYLLLEGKYKEARTEIETYLTVPPVFAGLRIIHIYGEITDDSRPILERFENILEHLYMLLRRDMLLSKEFQTIHSQFIKSFTQGNNLQEVVKAKLQGDDQNKETLSRLQMYMKLMTDIFKNDTEKQNSVLGWSFIDNEKSEEEL